MTVASPRLPQNQKTEKSEKIKEFCKILGKIQILKEVLFLIPKRNFGILRT